MFQMKSQKPRGYLCWFGMLLLILSLPARASEFNHGVLWKISKPGVAPSYLLGTIHSDDPRVTRLPPAVERAFDLAHSFTGELDMSANSLTQTEQAMLLPAGQHLENILGQARYHKCVKLLANYGVSASVVDRMKPWAIAVQLNMPRPVTDNFLDLNLYRRAVARGIPVHALETIPEQIAVFDKLPQVQQITLLDEAIANYHNTAAMIDTLIDLYLARDLSGLQAINNQQLQQGNAQLAAEIQQRLITMRNLRMAKRMQPILQGGDAFIAVGALHLPGKQGILKLLQQQGYQIQYVY